MKRCSLTKKVNLKLPKIVTTFAIVLMLTVTVFFTNLPSVDAATAQIDTFLYVMAAPNPVGVGQQVVVTMQLDKLSPTAVGYAGGEHFKGITVKITNPDGTSETKGPYETWSISGYYFVYTPTQAGKHTMQASFPGQWINTTTTSQAPYNRNTQYWFKPSTSGTLELTVQQQQIAAYPDIPLPTNYWTRPISGEFKGMWQISDNWLMRAYDRQSGGHYRGQAFAPYTSAPDSAHIMWTRPVWFGGIGGGKFGDMTFYTGMSYEQPFEPLILNGRIIYTEFGPSDVADKFGTRCLDLYSGEEIWYLNKTNIAFAQLVNIENVNEHGLVAYLWETVGTNWKMYDAFTGTYILTVANVTSGSIVTGPNGEVLTYSISGQSPNRQLVLWNSSRVIFYAFPYARYAQIYEPGSEWNPRVGTVIDGNLGIQYNVSIGSTPGSIAIVDANDDILITSNMDTASYPYVYTHAGFDTKTGQQLWIQNRTDIYDFRVATGACVESGVYVLIDRPKLQIKCYDARTGNKLWDSDPMPQGWAYQTRIVEVAYDKVVVQSWDGYVRAYDAKTGKLSWEYYFGSSGYETVFGTWPTNDGFTIADRKVFLFNDEHSPNAVLWRGAKLWCLSVDTGKLLWSSSGWLDSPCVSDGYLIADNAYDNQIYCFGKGPSATTVTAPQTMIPKGTGLLLTGAVSDQSSGAKQLVEKGKFSAVPAVSDDSMSAFMEYVYMQKPKPANATGVNVKLTAYDPNGNSQNIGVASTDFNGKYAIAWTPTLEGTYSVVAEFEGSNSYWPSQDTAYFAVGPAAAQQPTSSPTPTQTIPPTVTPTATASPSPAPQPEAGPSTDMYIIAAAAVVIIVVVAVAALVLRKRK